MQTRASIASLAFVSLLSACSNVTFVGEYGADDGADDIAETTGTTGGDTTDESTDGGPNQGCCECVDGVESCWLAPEGNCEPGETLLEGCNVVVDALSCGLDCEADPGPQPWCCWCGPEGEAACLPWAGEEACAATGAAYGVDAHETPCTGVPILGNLECALACPLPVPDFVGCCYCDEVGDEICVTGTAEQCGWQAVEYFDCGEVDGALSCGACEAPPEPGYCCTCSPIACYPATSDEPCTGEWNPIDSCTVTPERQVDCGNAC